MALTTRHKWLNRLLAGTLCVVAVCVVQQASVLMAADWSSSMARNALDKWVAGKTPYTPAQRDQARRALESAIARTPKDATLHDALAQLHSLDGRELWTTGAPDSPEVAAYQKALQHQKASIALRPTHAMAWANLALMQYAINDTPEALLASWREAARLGPREAAVTETLTYVATQIWPIAPDDLRAWVEERRPGTAERLEATVAPQQ